MNDRFNTIAGWVLGGGIVLLGATLVTGEVFSGHRPDKMGYEIEGVEEEAGKGGAAKEEQPIAALLATADAGRGETVFKGKCASCHTIVPGGPNQIGPNIHAIMGQPVAARGYAYSDALKGKGGTWTWEAMSDWLKNPKAYAPGTKMTFAGIPDGQDRADLLMYLNAQGSNLPMPAAPAASADPADASQVEARGNESSPDANGAAPKQPIVNEGQGASAPKGGGEMRPDSNLKGGQ